MKRLSTLTLTLAAVSILWSCVSKQENMENRMREFISSYELKVIPLYRDAALASWNANIPYNEEWAKSEKASFELAKSIPTACNPGMRSEGIRMVKILLPSAELLYNFYLGRSIHLCSQNR
jgi:hypothetical protein